MANKYISFLFIILEVDTWSKKLHANSSKKIKNTGISKHIRKMHYEFNGKCLCGQEHAWIVPMLLAGIPGRDVSQTACLHV